MNAEGKGNWDFAPAVDSKIVFITESGTIPKVVIVTYTEKVVDIDHNVGKKTVTGEKIWVKYYFHIPKSVIKSFDTD